MCAHARETTFQSQLFQLSAADRSQVSAAFAPPSEEPEAVTQMKEHLRTRMREQEESEVANKKRQEDESRSFLEVRVQGLGFGAAAELQSTRRGCKLVLALTFAHLWQQSTEADARPTAM